MERASALDPKRFYGWGPGLRVDWGDGTTWPVRGSARPDTTSITTHTYTVAGNYQIKAFLYHHSANDSAINDWLGEAEVQLASGTNSKEPDLQILEPVSGEVFGFQEFPMLKWRLHTDRRVTIKFQFLDPFGKVIGEDELRGISYNTELQEKRVSPRSFEALESSLASGNHKFKVRMTLLDDSGQSLLSKETPFFTMTSEYKSRNLRPFLVELEGRPLEVNLAYKTYHSDDVSYILDWGDGSAPEERIRPIPEKGSMLKSKQLLFRHTYPRPGKYEIRIRSNDGRIFTDVHKMPYYESAIVELKGDK